MHIEVIDDLNMIIYLSNIRYKFESNTKEALQDMLKDLFSRLKDYYDININGFYNITVFKDNNYGLVLELQKEDIDYIDYFDGQVDMNITFENNVQFLYEIDDFFNLDEKLIEKVKLYKYKGKIYMQISKNISHIDMGKIIEFSKIIYNDSASQIIKKGEMINIKHSFAT